MCIRDRFYSLRGSDEYSLFSTINKCSTAMGQRLLRNWLLRPLKHKIDIEQRYENISELTRSKQLLDKLNLELGNILDIERLTSRLATGSINARDLVFLKDSLKIANNLYSEIHSSKSVSYTHLFTK